VRWRPFFWQFREPPQHGRVSWRHEIWPFQWRIAVSWTCGYFVFDILNPIALYFCGPVEAGRFGMSLQLVTMIARVALTWISTKSPQFGILIARRAWGELDALWRRSTVQVFVFYLLGYGAFLLAVPVAGHFIPRIPARLAPWPVNVWLGAGLITQVLVGAMATELRAHKREPLMWMSVLNAALSVALILPLVHFFGILGEAIGYAFGLWIVFFPNYQIYRVKRLEFRGLAAGSGESGGAAASPQAGGIS
jgi:O-antigen/teichoic acid export membrane protein